MPVRLDPAEVAGEYAERNGASLVSCECPVESFEAVVSVRMPVGTLLLFADDRRRRGGRPGRRGPAALSAPGASDAGQLDGGGVYHSPTMAMRQVWPRRGKRALLATVDYTLAKRALLRQMRTGLLSRADICDAHPELIRAAKNVGENSAGPARSASRPSFGSSRTCTGTV